MAAQVEPTSEAPRKRGDWEWFWRFLAVVMVFVVGWVIWIAIQINPPPLVTAAAYEAAAKARASRNAQGLIQQAPSAPAAAASAPSPLEPADPEAEKKLAAPLRLSDTLEKPPAEPAAQ
jgi:hypothetical protein